MRQKRSGPTRHAFTDAPPVTSAMLGVDPTPARAATALAQGDDGPARAPSTTCAGGPAGVGHGRGDRPALADLARRHRASSVGVAYIGDDHRGSWSWSGFPPPPPRPEDGPPQGAAGAFAFSGPSPDGTLPLLVPFPVPETHPARPPPDAGPPNFRFRTGSVPAPGRPAPAAGPSPPVYRTTSFVFEDAADAADLFALQKYGNIYSRIANPTVAVFEERMASLEGGIGAVARRRAASRPSS